MSDPLRALVVANDEAVAYLLEDNLRLRHLLRDSQEQTRHAKYQALRARVAQSNPEVTCLFIPEEEQNPDDPYTCKHQECVDEWRRRAASSHSEEVPS